MRPVQLVVDTNVVSYMFNESPLGIAYEELIGSRDVGITGYSIAEVRAGVVMARWGERRLAEHARFLDEFSHVADTREMAELCGAIRAMRSRVGRPRDAFESGPLLLSESPSRSLALRACRSAHQ